MTPNLRADTADSSDCFPVRITQSMAGAIFAARSMTCSPLIPGMSRSTIMQSKRFISMAAIAVNPSGHTVTLCPM